MGKSWAHLSTGTITYGAEAFDDESVPWDAGASGMLEDMARREDADVQRELVGRFGRAQRYGEGVRLQGFS